MGAGCSGLICFGIKYLWRNVHRKMGAFFIHFVTFTNTLVYSVVWNQSTCPTYLSEKYLSMISPGTIFSQYRRFLMIVPDYTLLAASATIPFAILKPLSSSKDSPIVKIGSHIWSISITVIPKSKYSFGTICDNISFPLTIYASKNQCKPTEDCMGLIDKIMWFAPNTHESRG